MRKIFFALCGICVLAIMSIFIVLGCGGKIIRDKKHVNNKIYSKISLSYICPNSFNDEKVIDFACVSLPLADTQYFVQIQYTKQEYDEEIQRLSNVKNEKSDGTNYLFYDETCTFFSFPTYVSHYKMGVHYAYACLEEERSIITYVYALQEDVEDIIFDTKYLPRNYTLLQQFANSKKTMCFDIEHDRQKNVENWYNKLDFYLQNYS